MSYSEDYQKRTIEYRGEGHMLEEIHAVFKSRHLSLQYVNGKNSGARTGH